MTVEELREDLIVSVTLLSMNMGRGTTQERLVNATTNTVDSLIAAARQEGAERAIRESSVGTLTCHSGMLGQTYGDKPITSFNEGDRYALVLLPKEANSEQT